MVDVISFLSLIQFLDVAVCNLVHDVETIHCLCQLIKASGNLFLK